MGSRPSMLSNKRSTPKSNRCDSACTPAISGCVARSVTSNVVPLRGAPSTKMTRPCSGLSSLPIAAHRRSSPAARAALEPARAGCVLYINRAYGAPGQGATDRRRRHHRAMSDRYDTLVVGAGYAGTIMAERLASQLGQQVLVIDRRGHIAGNAHDYYDEHGVLVHKYGPHIFHTNSQKVIDYMSEFTDWRPYEHRVLARVDDQLLPIPINRTTLNELYGLSMTTEDVFERMLDHPLIDVQLETRYEDIKTEVEYDHLVYTGPIDAFFDYRFGALPYRSLEFELKNEPTPDGGYLLAAAQVNEPSEDVLYTRTTEFRRMTGQDFHPTSTVAYEYPRSEGDPYYPIPRDDTRALYKCYEALAAEFPDVTFVGRLARYQYLNMDQVVGQALAAFERFAEALPVPG